MRDIFCFNLRNVSNGHLAKVRIVCLLGKGFVMKFLAAMFIGMGTYALLHGKKEIDNVEQQLQNQQSEDTEDGRF